MFAMALSWPVPAIRPTSQNRCPRMPCMWISRPGTRCSRRAAAIFCSRLGSVVEVLLSLTASTRLRSTVGLQPARLITRVQVCPSRQQHTPNGRHRPGRLPLTRPRPSGRPAAVPPRTRRARAGQRPAASTAARPARWAAGMHGERRAALAAGLQVPGVVPAGMPARLVQRDPPGREQLRQRLDAGQNPPGVGPAPGGFRWLASIRAWAPRWRTARRAVTRPTPVPGRGRQLAAGLSARLHRGSTRQASEDRPAVAGGTGQDGQVSGGKRDAGDAHVLADMVRTDSHQGEPPTWGGHAGDDRVAFVDTRDVADVAAAILVEGPGIADTVRAKAPFPSEASWWRGDRATSCPRMARRLRLAGEAEVWAEHRRARLPADTHVPPGTATSLQQTDMCTVCVAPAALKERRSSRAFQHRPRWDLPRLFAA